MTDRTISKGKWVTYPDGLRVFHLNPPEEAMDEPPVADLCYLTIPSPQEPLLNIQINGRFFRLKLTRNQAYELNADIADALARGRQRRLPNGQLDLSLDSDTQH